MNDAHIYCSEEQFEEEFAEKSRSACVGVTGEVVTTVIVPLTRGSTTTLRPVMVAMVRATASISALAKLSVTGPLARPATAAGAVGIAAAVGAAV